MAPTQLTGHQMMTLEGRMEYLNSFQVDALPEKFKPSEPKRERFKIKNLFQKLVSGGDDTKTKTEKVKETPIIQDGLFADQKFEKIRSHYLFAGNLFTDPMFPPAPHSINSSGKCDSSIVWKRASELCEDPKLVVSGATRFDINQGELGDCWLSAAMANLTLFPKFFGKVVPIDDQGFDKKTYAGIFRFRFWQYGEWVDIVVDDYLPTKRGRLIYMQSDDKNEFWSALLEKAYAKLYGSYEALRSGQALEAMIDFTGGVGETINLKREPIEDILKIMLRAHQLDSMLSASINPIPGVVEGKTSTGLVCGHAYSVTKVVVAKIIKPSTMEVPLVRIRNPWGDETEWNGAWSDGSKEWTLLSKTEKERLGLTFDQDGEFFMTIQDFVVNFDKLEICNLSPDSFGRDESNVGKLQWHETRFTGSWIKGKTAGGCRNNKDTFSMNPQFKVELKDSDADDDDLATTIISLMQKDTRFKAFDECPAIGFYVYHITKPEKTTFPLDPNFFRYNASKGQSKIFTNSREVSARFKFQPGTYVVVPSTFNPGEEGEFLLRLFTEAPTS